VENIPRVRYPIGHISVAEMGGEGRGGEGREDGRRPRQVADRWNKEGAVTKYFMIE
jgi:hypothetical protein